MSHVFLSYVREDADIVDQFAKELGRAGVPVWLDRLNLRPGDIWIERIKVAIKEASLCVVCFLDKFVGRNRSIANEELTLAIAETNRRPWNRPWLVPVCLSKCEIPPIPIRPEVDLSHVHTVDLSRNWRQGILQIVQLFHDSEPQNVDSDPPPLGLDEARAIIQQTATQLRISVRETQAAPQSPFLTGAFRAREVDGKGVIYCHANGPFQSAAFYVRKGIGYYYEYVLGGSASRIGLPVSNEELISPDHFATSYFERGYIEWSQRTGVARSVAYTSTGDRSFHDQKL